MFFFSKLLISLYTIKEMTKNNKVIYKPINALNNLQHLNWVNARHIIPVETLGFKTRICPPYPHARRKRRLKWGGFSD